MDEIKTVQGVVRRLELLEARVRDLEAAASCPTGSKVNRLKVTRISDLERRCRNAEKLLDECRSIMAANGLYPITQKRVSAHLAAAAQEDGK